MLGCDERVIILSSK